MKKGKEHNAKVWASKRFELADNIYQGRRLGLFIIIIRLGDFKAM